MPNLPENFSVVSLLIDKLVELIFTISLTSTVSLIHFSPAQTPANRLNDQP